MNKPQLLSNEISHGGQIMSSNVTTMRKNGSYSEIEYKPRNDATLLDYQVVDAVEKTSLQGRIGDLNRTLAKYRLRTSNKLCRYAEQWENMPESERGSTAKKLAMVRLAILSMKEDK